ncbi:hypothetical protein Fmac_028838 [Flemingia macrophylla]|uniref:Ribosomal protein L35A n=1 Tax=Flemingia macrophylla TaxID=520843 RepID=A0ABD1L8M4_9FABA
MARLGKNLIEIQKFSSAKQKVRLGGGRGIAIAIAIAIAKMVKGRQGERVRLYVRGSILGYKRSKSNQYPNTSLIQIEGVNSKEEVAYYCGKRMAYIYKAKVKKNGSHYRCIWGKVTRPHGNTGVVRAKFKSNLPPRSMTHFYALAGSKGQSLHVS